jgi:hypothetical protein
MNLSPAISSENPVQQHLRRDVDRLLVLALLLTEARLRPADLHGLVLQRTLAALVAHRAVQRVVDEQQLHHTLLGLAGDLGGQLRTHHHAVGDRLGARGDRLALALHVHQALPAGAGRSQQRVVAEPRDVDAHPLGGADDQLALGRGHLDAVDGERDGVGVLLYFLAH